MVYHLQEGLFSLSTPAKDIIADLGTYVSSEVTHWQSDEGGVLGRLSHVVLLELDELRDQRRQGLGRRRVGRDILQRNHPEITISSQE